MRQKRQQSVRLGRTAGWCDAKLSLDADRLKGDLFNLIYYRLDFFQTEE